LLYQLQFLSFSKWMRRIDNIFKAQNYLSRWGVCFGLPEHA
jgi:hypothetical protein